MLRIGEVTGGVRLEVRVQPRSSRNQGAGEQDGVWKVKLTAPPVDGEANSALIGFLAEVFKIPRKDIKIIKGETSRHKIVEIKGISAAEILQRIDN